MKLTLNRYLGLLLGLFFILPNAIGQVSNFDKTWDEFLKNEKVSNVSELVKPPKTDAKNYAKYCLIYATTRFCNSKITQSEEFLAEIESLGVDQYGVIPGFQKRYTDMKTKMEAYHKTDELWEQFLISHSVNLSELGRAKAALRVCEKGTLAKYTYMEAYGYYCSGDVEKAKNRFDTRVLAIVDRTSLRMEDVNGLSGEVANMRSLITAIHKLDSEWARFMSSGKTNGFSQNIPVFKCNKTPLLKKHILEAASDLCGRGEAELETIRELKGEIRQGLDQDIVDKIAWLESEVGNGSGDVAKIDAIWSEYVEYGYVDEEPDISQKFCKKEYEVKSLVLYGYNNYCRKGQEMLDKVDALVNKYNLDLSLDAKRGVKILADKVEEGKRNIRELNQIWAEFKANNDTIDREFVLAGEYCENYSQLLSWVIKGNFDHCDQGEHYLGWIDNMLKENKVTIDEELKCRIQRLRVKVWNCQIDKIHREVQLATVAERERLATSTTQSLERSLNDKVSCRTKVKYEVTDTMGFGLIMNISTVTCRNMDLAKLTELEYIQTVADWLNNDLIAPYCRESDACAEDLYLYIVGHTDGSPMNGEIYTGEYSIPAESPFLHIKNGEEKEGATTREIQEKVNNKEELAFARAFTVSYQLEDHVDAPIYLAVNDHDEVGHKYNKIEISINLSNLLKDKFHQQFEKEVRDAGLWGGRPDNCE